MTTARSRISRTGAVAVLLVAALVAGFWAGRAAPRSPERPANEIHVADTATVLTAVRKLARLEGVAYHMERIIDLKERQLRLFGLLQADDQILLVAAGDVVAGIDLSKMGDGDVVIEPSARRARLRLPAPEIFSVRLDNDRTYVHGRKTDLLAARGEQLESKARQYAERSIRDAALASSILDRARQSVESTLTVLVRSLGYDRVEQVWQPPSPEREGEPAP